ncbi:phosphodiester glycosidase family protein [Myroides sp. M-43]|uniref:phosphodiester glycosidase family protein n=1 Tax=Myroides oncorhynchi TaxID=2893756 RepID=UPI001E3D6CA0|nr:phosphodiester glycosidase family protein [Myroides oncorhynchi]MCC9043076.1 phosphodiester glycosidase family protein [Myroides oncorhynchi]
MISKIYKDSVYTLTEGVTVNELSYLSNQDKAMKVFIYKVDLSNPKISIATTLPNNELKFAMQPMTEQAKAAQNPFFNILGGVNGDFYNMTTGVPQGIYVTYGAKLKSTYNDKIKGFLSVDKHNKVNLFDIEQFNIQSTTIQHAISGGDWLVKDSQIIPQNNTDIHPRTAVGLTTSNQLILLVVDGRNPQWSNGMNLEELATMMLALGADRALNLDGGGSSTFFTNPNLTENKYTIRNLPSDKNAKERAVSNGVIITEVK